MFVCECECVTNHAVVCVQTGGFGGGFGAGAAGMTWGWGLSITRYSMPVVRVAEWSVRSRVLLVLDSVGHVS